MSKPLIILGNGGHASVLMETLLKQEQGYEIIGFTTPIMEDNSFGLVYLGHDEVIYNYNPEEVNLVLGLGMLGPSSAREKTFKHFKEKGYFFKSIIHPFCDYFTFCQVRRRCSNNGRCNCSNGNKYCR